MEAAAEHAAFHSCFRACNSGKHLPEGKDGRDWKASQILVLK